MMNFAQIIPLTKLPRKIDYFDYKIPSHLQGKLHIGDIVQIPMRLKYNYGVVLGLSDSSNFAHAKEIVGKAKNFAPLQAKELAFLQWFSQYYHYSLASTLKLYLPEPPQRKVAFREKLTRQKQEPAIKKEISALAKKILAGPKKKYLLFPHLKNTRYGLYLSLMAEILKNQQQALILLPTTQKVNQFIELLPGKWSDKIVKIDGQAHRQKNNYFDIWQRLQSGRPLIVVGTRSAVFVPFLNLKLIIVDEAQSEDFKQWDMTPRYQAVRVCQQIADLNDCHLILQSNSLPIEQAFNAKKENYQIINLGIEKTRDFNIINLKNNYQNAYLSQTLLNEIGQVHDNKKNSLLIVNKKGMHSYVACADCGHEYLCQGCQLPLSLDNENNLHCYHCDSTQKLSLNCPKCGSVNIKKLGIGIQQVEKFLKNEFGNDVVMLDEKIRPEEASKIYLSAGQYLNDNLLANLALLGFVYIDGQVHLSDYTSNQRLYSFAKEIIASAFRAKIIFQTAFPQNPAIANLNLPYAKFYLAELHNREQFGYPPFSLAVNLIFDHHDNLVAQKEAFDLYQKLTIADNTLKISEPFLTYRQKVRNRYRYQIVIFFANSEQENAIITQVPEYWTIDKDPINVL